MKVYPIAMTTVDWNLFSTICDDELGYIPTRGLDQTIIKKEDAASFVACVDMNNQPIQALESLSSHWLHASLSFLVVVDDLKHLDIIKQELFLPMCKRGHIAIITATMYDWFIRYEYTCSDVTANFLKQCSQFIKQTGYRRLWDKKRK